MQPTSFADHVRFDANGLVVAVAQDHISGEVLMVAYMTKAALWQTLETGLMTYWSRSRATIWVKGETSGHLQEVREVFLDCDGDALVFKIHQQGAGACHTGHRSCFYRRMENGAMRTGGTPAFDPRSVYKT